MRGNYDFIVVIARLLPKQSRHLSYFTFVSSGLFYRFARNDGKHYVKKLLSNNIFLKELVHYQPKLCFQKIYQTISTHLKRCGGPEPIARAFGAFCNFWAFKKLELMQGFRSLLVTFRLTKS